MRMYVLSLLSVYSAYHTHTSIIAQHAHTHTRTHTRTHTHTHMHTASSVIWVDGQQAMVTFTSNGDGTSTAHVSANTSYTYAIHQNPVDHTLDPSMRCSVDCIGDNITQPLNFHQDATDRIVAIAITELAFRSIAVYNGDGTVRACGTILPTTELLDVDALKAVFTSVVAGTVYLAEIRGKCVELPACMHCRALCAPCSSTGAVQVVPVTMDHVHTLQ